MTISTADVGRILAKCSGYRPDKTPNYSDLVAMAWTEHFEDFPAVTADDALEAVKVYHREPQDRMIQPADISKIARGIRRDKSEKWTRADQDEHEAYLDAKTSGRVKDRDEWDALKAANKHRLAELMRGEFA